MQSRIGKAGWEGQGGQGKTGKVECDNVQDLELAT